MYVVPYIGTWIETLGMYPETHYTRVVPYIGTWIETTPDQRLTNRSQSYLI